jgi:transcriptional regulator with XRE-family HTH domain
MDYPEVLRAIMQAGKLNQAKLAKRLKVTQPTVSRWLRRLSKPDHDQHMRIEAEAIKTGVTPPQSPNFEAEAPDERGAPTVKVVGYVGAGAAAHFYAVAQGDLDEVPAPEGATAETVAVEIRGNSLGELFDRWLVFYDDVRRPVTSDLIGRLCVIGLSDDRVLVKKIRRGRDGLYDLHSNNEDPIRDAVIEWAARVKNMVPR